MRYPIGLIAILVAATAFIAAPASAADGQIDIASLPYIISKSGSYIVVTDLIDSTDDGVNGITITVDNVTLDLNGHTLTGPGKSASMDAVGIFVDKGGDSRRDNITIRNGALTKWPDDAVGASDADESAFEHLHAYRNGGVGIKAGQNCRVSGSLCSNNSGNGIETTGEGGLIIDNVTNFNSGAGISAGEGATISRNTSWSNSGVCILAHTATITDNVAGDGSTYGIDASGASTIIGNSTSVNSDTGIRAGAGSTITNNTSFDNGGGIDAGNASTVSGNTCYDNFGDAIKVADDCRVVENTCSSHNSGAGVHATGSGNVILRNHLTNNATGLDIDDAVNYSSQNTLSDNTTNEDLGGSIEGAGDLANIIFDTP